jgi:hypothetical protein
MDDYNSIIASRILDNVERMINTTAQPQMLGGKRMRKFVLPSSTEYDYPSSLSVGSMTPQKPALLSGVDEFKKSFPVKKRGIKAPVVVAGKRGESNPRKVGGKVHLEEEEPEEEEDVEGGAFNFGKAFKSVTKPLAKIATKAVSKVASKAIDEAPMMMMAAGKSKKRGRPKKMMGSDPSTYTPECVEAGALIKNKPAEFQSSLYPPALASYSPNTKGSGLAKPKRVSARGQLVSKVMKQKGLSLAEASKYIKANNLY